MTWKSQQLLNRRFASKLNSEDAYVTGYFYSLFQNDKVFDKVYQLYSKLYQSTKNYTYDIPISSGSDMIHLLAATCTAAPTIPGGTLNKSTITALGGTKWGAAGSIDYGDTVTLKFVEFSGIPVAKTISSWFNLIRDRNAGRSNLGKGEYTKSNFYGNLSYFTTKPNGVDIEFAIVLEGVCPLKDPMDLFTSDVGTVDGLQLDIDFHVDSIWWDNRAYKMAEKALKTLQGLDKYKERPSLNPGNQI